MSKLDKYAIVEQIATRARKAEYEFQLRLGANFLDAIEASWAVYTDIMNTAFYGTRAF